jgi:hypothetical protein
LIVTRKIRIFKFWLKLLNANNCILKGCYEFLYDMCLESPNNMNNWVCNIRKELCNIGLNDLWNSQAILSKNVIFLIKQRLFDIAKQEFDAVLSVSSKCYFYQYIVTNGCLQEYLCKPIPELYNKCITKITLSSHKLVIEQGRYNKINRNRRTCKLCINEIENEMHVILLCPSYVNLRKQLIKSYYWKKRLFIKCCNY